MGLIYRVETEGGDGLYSKGGNQRVGDNSYPADIESSSYFRPGHDDHPIPERDKELGWDDLELANEHRPWVFGFANTAQLLRWTQCHAVRKDLHSYGFHVAVYKCKPNKFRIGTSQAIFIRGEAKLIGQIPIINF